MLSDEIVCGFGRTGEWFGHQSMGFAPDMMSCGKSLTAGYQPLSCVVVGGHLYNSLEEQTAKLNGFGHGFTYSGHPVSAAVALEAVSIYQQMNVSSHVKDRAMVLAKSLETHCIHEQIYEIRQIGLMAAIQLTSVKGHYSPHTDVHIGVELDRAARRHGLIVRIIGNSTIAICPPYIVSDSQIDFISKKISASLNDVLGVG